MPAFSKPQIRPTVARVDLAALQRNYRRLAQVAGDARVLAAVKGDAYGHGAVRCALALQDAGCEAYGVALIEEGRALREAGVRGELLVLSGAGFGGTEVALDRNLTMVIFDHAVAARISEQACRRGVRHPVHLKVDTGMGRLGVSWREWPAFVAAMAALPGLDVVGVLSHLAGAEDDPEGTAVQVARFRVAADQARAVGLAPRHVHLSNSAGLLTGVAPELTMVRPGLALYGASPGAGLGLDLEPVMTVRTRVLHVRDLQTGDGVSYGQTWRAERPSRIAWLPVGYADGYLRELSNVGEVLVGGQRAPVRGRVCMDLTAVDVTDIPGVAHGDEVVLLGRQGEQELRVERIAELAHTIPYEVLTRFSERVPRRHLVASTGGFGA